MPPWECEREAREQRQLRSLPSYRTRPLAVDAVAPAPASGVIVGRMSRWDSREEAGSQVGAAGVHFFQTRERRRERYWPAGE